MTWLKHVHSNIYIEQKEDSTPEDMWNMLASVSGDSYQVEQNWVCQITLVIGAPSKI